MIVAVTALAGCSFFESAMKVDKTVTNVKKGQLVDSPNSATDDSAAYCCVNGAYFDCPSAGALAQCVGEPNKLSSCFMSGGCDNACANECMSKYGPDPSSCRRDSSKDNTCPSR